MTSPIALFLDWEQKQPDRDFLRQPLESGKKVWSYKQAGDEARRLAQALRNMGLQKGDKVAILSKNCAHWIIADLAIMMGGYISVPLYATITAETIESILLHSESKAVFVGKLDDYASQAAGIPETVEDIVIEAYGNTGTNVWETLVQTTPPIDEVFVPTNREELVSIMYTSGTTGNPKGVMHTYGNFSMVLDRLDIIGIPLNPEVFSYLPLSHIAERIGIEMAGITRGGTFNFPYSLDTFGADLQAVQPHYFFAVPRIWQKFREKVEEKLPPAKMNRLLGVPIIGGLIKKKIRKGIGLSRSVRAFSGAAPLAIDLMHWYKKIGVDIYQVYGMTEDCIYCHFNLPQHNKIGSVGKPLPGLLARISSEGEIQVKCEALTKGYYKEPELTAELFTEDGYLHTGDVGEYDSDGFLFITGRLKDQFKTDKGKYIAPGPIETTLASHPLIDQACVVGMGLPQPIALTTLLPEAINGMDRHAIEKALVKQVAVLNEKLLSHERVSKVVVLPETWSVENGLMTPTLKVKRNVLEKKFRDKYAEWYHTHGEVIWE